MKKLFLLLIVIAALVPTVMAADPVTDKVYAIVNYAEQYEMGQITYPELKIYSNALRDDIRELMGNMVLGKEEEHYEGVSKEAAESFFGTPTDYTDWVWAVNEEKEVKIEEKMPRWEKVVFDGKKVQVTFNAWPQAYIGEGSAKRFYWVDFQVRFKKQFSFNLGEMQSEVKSLAVEYLNTKGNAEELARKLADYSGMLRNYMEQNRENCELMLEKFFTSEDKSQEQEFIVWESTLYEGDRFRLIAMTRICESCEWTMADTWLETRYEGPAQKGSGGEGGSSYKIEELREKEIPELLGMLKAELEKARDAGPRLEKGEGSVVAFISNLQVIHRALSEKYNWDQNMREENRQAYISAVEDILSGYKSDKTKVKELRYERRLVQDMITRTESWCRQVQQEDCAIDEGCIGGECIFALGGNEDCGNKADDDGDTLADCLDPDCARQCGRLCKDYCEEGCWPCMNQCNSVCRECSDCERENGGGEQCNSVCEAECWPCRNGNCWDQAICSECRACEEAGREMPACEMECGPCSQCTKTKDPEACTEECKLCVECKSPAVNPACEEGCGKITAELKEQLQPCLELCKQNVVFYCSGSKQYSPCEDTTYICEGNQQLLPCLIYTCPGDVKQNVPCGQEAFCGENQVAEGERCKCRAGWYDCNGDGKGCESGVPCSENMEICDDKTDNDNDLMIDCEDLADCREGMPCAVGKVCFTGKCVSQEEVNVTARCGENEAYKDGVCQCADGYAEWGGKCVPSAVNITCEDGFVLADGVCVPEAANETCPEGYKLENGICVPEEVSCPEGYELKEGRCVPIVQECPGGYELIDGICKPIAVNATEGLCPEGYELKDGVCLPKVTECPEGYELKEGVCTLVEKRPECGEGFVVEEGKCVPKTGGCPEGYAFMDGICIFVGEKIECAENEVLEAGKCVSKSVYEGTEVRPEETGKACVLAEDCGSERAICSNGFCKEIPEDVYQREYGGEAAQEVIIPEQPVETIVQRHEAPAEEPMEEGREEMRKEMPEGGEGMPEQGGERMRPEGGESPEEGRGERPEEPMGGERPEGYGGGEAERAADGGGFGERPEDVGEERSDAPREDIPAPGGITGAFAWIETALRGISFAKASDLTPCSSNADCHPNQQCDTVMGQCHCNDAWFDCNSLGDGDDADGCESQDPTCGGSRELCPEGCGENKYCDAEKGRCECNKGFYDCDGNWNDCESEKPCKACKTDEDCAEQICAPWGENVLIKFGCVEGQGWEEENGVIAFSGGCNFKPTGKVDSYLNFDSWGDGFEEVSSKRMGMEQGGAGWCISEAESFAKERKELEEGLNEEFLKWFFDTYLVSEPDKWENRMSGIYSIYWALVDNARETARTSQCTGNSPAYNPIDIEYESGFGKVHIWEEKKSVEEFGGAEVLSPYMEIWIFPPKDILKNEILTAREGGYMPGPPEQRVKEIGPSAKEKEDVRSNPDALKEFEDIASDFGGSLDSLVTVRDGDEDLFYIKATVNKDVIFEGKPVKSVDFEPDVTVEVQLDFLYGIIKGSEQHGEIQSPPWDSGRRVRNMVSDAVAKGVIGAKVAVAFATGDIKVKPLSAVPKVLKFVNMAMGGERPGGPGTREQEE